MDLILWRHAQAEPGSEEIPDLSRKLTGKGIKQAAKMAHWLDRNLPERCKILVSPSSRTRETIAMLERKFKIVPELGPDADADTVLQLVNWPNTREPVLIVGHQPYLGQVAARLIAPMQLECAIRKGNVWWISQKTDEDGALYTYLKAIMPPELASK
jgi:phosphohistidine phosphatase